MVDISEAKGLHTEVSRRTRAGRRMETVHIDLAGPYEASMGGSLYLIMFVSRAPPGEYRRTRANRSVRS